MKKNVGQADAFFRITIGLFGLAWSVSRMVHRPDKTFPKFIALTSAMKVTEGLTRFCPGLALFNVNTNPEEESRRKVPYGTIKYARTKIEPPHSSEEERGECR